MDEDIIERNAIGRIATFGAVYDARNDTFCGGSILQEQIPSAALIDTTDSTFKLTRLVENDTFAEKFGKMDICPDVQISILSRITPELHHSGKFLDNHKRSARVVKCSIVCSVKTQEEMLDFSCWTNYFEHFMKETKSMREGTHIVVGISQGANCVLSFTVKCTDDTKFLHEQAVLSSHLKKVLRHNNREPTVIDNDLNNLLDCVKTTLYSDIGPEEDNHPHNWNEGIQFLDKFPLMAIKNYIPLVYKLLPITVFCKKMKIQVTSPKIYFQLKHSFASRIVELFDRMLSAHREVHDYSQDVIKFKYCVPEEHLDEVKSLQKQLKSSHESLRDKLAPVIISIRSATLQDPELDAIIQSYYKSEHSPQKLLNKLKSWDTAQQKIKLAQELVSKGVIYVGNGHELNNDDLVNPTNRSVVIYFRHQNQEKNLDQWNDNFHIFLERLKTKHAKTKYYAVDCDFHKNFKLKSKNSCVEVYRNAECIVNDMLAYQDKEFSKETPWIQFLAEPEAFSIEPKKLGSLTVACPCTNPELDKIKEWYCTVCFETVNYGFDGNIYCDCGRTPTQYAEFKCPDAIHGKEFQLYQNNRLTKYLEEIIPFSETNLLILGETGVGKSTWINSFINFLTYESLPEAEAGGLRTLIPGQFTVYDENLQPITVSTGSSANEMIKKGHSATQHSKIYKFQIGKEIIRLIDTPGIGDTRGIEQDKENFQDILQTLSQVHELHGICILLKPNNARINVVFRFCIKELLTNLHRDASKNIVFCFTNSRGTFYRPGDTMPALQELLNENKSVELLLNQETVYCFDSEAYRFLAAIMNVPPVTFPNEHKANFEKSWEESIAETKRLLGYVNSLRPHNTTSTLNLNHARELVLNLTRPLAEISRNIHTNRTILERELKEIIDTEANMEDLKSRRFTTRTEIKTRPLEFPKTVCSNSDCIKLWTLSENVKTTEYVTICHSHCFLTGVTRDVIGHPLLMKCWALKETAGRECCNCEHPYNEHLHIYYDSVQVPVEVEDQAVIEAMLKGYDANQMKQNMILDRKAEILKFEEELKEIEQISVKFAMFLKCNAITPYNDGMEEYLIHLIKEEKDKVAQNANPEVLQSLERSLRSYMEERKILEDAMKKGKPGVCILDPADVENLVKKLKHLQLSGIYLNDALQCVEKARAAVFQEVKAQKCIKTKNKNLLSWVSKKFRSIKKQFKATDLVYVAREIQSTLSLVTPHID